MWVGWCAGVWTSDIASSPTQVTESVEPRLAIPDNDFTGVESAIGIAATGQARDVSVEVDITHTYIGDLELDLVAPSGQTVRLHDNEGGWADDIKRSYSLADTPALQGMVGQDLTGYWTCVCATLPGADVGTLNRWSITWLLSATVDWGAGRQGVLRRRGRPHIKVAGPSLTRCTAMCAPKRPTPTLAITRAGDADQVLEQALAFFGGCRRGKARPHPLCRIGRERKLRYEQQTPTDIGNAAVHLAVLVGKDPIADDALVEPLGLCLGVVSLHADKHQQTVAYGRDALRLDHHPRLGYTLQ